MVLKENREINHRSSDGDHWSVDGQAIFLEMCAWWMRKREKDAEGRGEGRTGRTSRTEKELV
jgi:hypothetical protein